MPAEKGLTLTELLIAIGIVLIVAALAIPNFLRSKIAANEAAAVSAIQTINRAEVSYQATYPTKGFAGRLRNLGGVKPCTPDPNSACLIDNTLANGMKNGYTFASVGITPAINGVLTDYTAGAAPAEYDKTGLRLFCSTSNAVIRYSANPQHSMVPPGPAECPRETPLE
jgi:type IV pilus assembly protein PilA